jgi:NAD(P)-dependent dehydrogenase (short-subunit alcohol dehydrogenase family)
MANKRILITGGARGIGAATARLFAENGADTVYIVDVDDANGENTAREISAVCDCRYRRLDVTDEVGAAELFKEIETGGGLDVLFNCAGITSVSGLFETDLALWNKIMAVNLTSAFIYSKEAMRLMCGCGYGRIINMSSVSAYVGGIRTSPAYATSKAAIIGLTRSLAKYGAPRRVTVNAIAPGIVDTEMTRVPGFVYSEREIPLGAPAVPEDIARAVLFLAGESGSHITGQCLNVNGGMYYN